MAHHIKIDFVGGASFATTRYARASKASTAHL